MSIKKGDTVLWSLDPHKLPWKISHLFTSRKEDGSYENRVYLNGPYWASAYAWPEHLTLVERPMKPDPARTEK